jgi:hypothetical protein
MNPQEEAKSLQQDPLPVVDAPGDATLPSQIAQIDAQIKVTEEIIRTEMDLIDELRKHRNELVGRALKLVRLEDARFRIVSIPVYPANHVLVDILRTTYPSEFETICKLQSDELQEKLKHVGEHVQIGELKSVIKDTARQMILIRPKGEPTFRYDVVEKK